VTHGESLCARWAVTAGDGADWAVTPEEQAVLDAERSKIEKSLGALDPKGVYVVIDTARNRLYLKKAKEVLLEAKCSTGSGKVLVAGDESWKFETPRGEFKILSRTRNPVWRKPDWAFLEEGEAVPSADSSDRYEKGVLGEYAFGIGRGYFIHGTLYTRLLGENVTHGCIRLGPEDLSNLAKRVRIGTKVYIF